ncbi:MAG: Rrf2 family transcriptional regulator [Deltaproteobacteria bacterium]|nr:Rrf2 family transcriptional regulator [Deltaproteobacteria bacterium]
MFSRTAEYALRAVVWLADRTDSSPLGVQPIAAGTQVPQSYLAKVLQELSQAGLVSSRRGVGGGYFLTRLPAEITVLDVINAVDPLQRITGCPLGLKSHRHAMCAMHARLDKAAALVEETLRASTIEELLRTPERPQPMKESVSTLSRPSR